MYIRQNNRPQGITIPKNYSGNAFSDSVDIFEADALRDDAPVSTSEVPSGEPSEDGDPACRVHSAKKLLPFNIGNEELILIGIILLISQNENGDGIIPILLAVLFLGGGIPSL